MAVYTTSGSFYDRMNVAGRSVANSLNTIAAYANTTLTAVSTYINVNTRAVYVGTPSGSGNYLNMVVRFLNYSSRRINGGGSLSFASGSASNVCWYRSNIVSNAHMYYTTIGSTTNGFNCNYNYNNGYRTNSGSATSNFLCYSLMS